MDLIRQIKENEELIKTDFGRQQLKSAKRNLKYVLSATEGMDAKERLSFTKEPRNTIKMLSGDDYYFTIDDGFEVYTIKKSTIERKKEKTVEYILKRFKKSIINARKYYAKKDDISEQGRQNQLDGLRRLKENVNKNIEMVRNNSEYFSIDKNIALLMGGAYPIFQDVVSMSISLNI